MASVGRKDGEECVALTPSEVEDIVILSHKNNSGGSHNEKSVRGIVSFTTNEVLRLSLSFSAIIPTK